MEIGSKLALYKCELIEPPNKEQPKFYKVTVMEKVYNSKKKIGGNWETAFYQGYIFDLSMDLEPAILDAGKNEKDKFSFDNISNPEKSIIRVLDFSFEKHSKWWGQTQQKDDFNRPIWEDIFYINKIADGTKTWRSENGEFKLLQRKYEAQKEKIAEQRRKNYDKDIECNKKIKQIEAEKRVLEQKIKKLEQIIEKQKKIVEQAEISVKETNKVAMVFKRKNTITEKQLEKTQNKLEEKKQEIKEVKKMKKDEVIQKAEEFDISYDDFDM